MRLSDVKKIVAGECERLSVNAEVKGVALHSREVRPGWVFVAVPGTERDGLLYAEDAVRRGAVAVVSEVQVTGTLAAALIRVKHARLAAATLAAAFHDYPARALALAGITGTNGKTTVATMVKAALDGAQLAPGMIGTIAYEIGSRVIAASRTTPDAVSLQQMLRQMVHAGCRSAVLEVSSHALVQHRTANIDFAAACFTNLTHDHLDYHGSMENYFEAKALLFRQLGAAATAVINRDDRWGRQMLDLPLACRRLSYGLEPGADLVATEMVMTLKGAAFQIQSPWGQYAARIQLPGHYNVSNALASFGVCCALGVAPDIVLEALAGLGTVRGRLEQISVRAPFAVFVDYAHTDDALSHALEALRPLTRGRLIVVFGCGGNRDRDKRRMMGAAATAGADRVIVTTDNPRHEQPEAIIADIMEGVDPSHAEVVVDRKAAIVRALVIAGPGDTVLIAGKGHETYQEVDGRVLPFNDADVVRKIFKR